MKLHQNWAFYTCFDGMKVKCIKCLVVVVLSVDFAIPIQAASMRSSKMELRIFLNCKTGNY